MHTYLHIKLLQPMGTQHNACEPACEPNQHIMLTVSQIARLLLPEAASTDAQL